jgi:adenylate cyclase
VPEIDFEAEGLLDGVEGEAREARLALLRDLAEAGVQLDEMRRAVAEDRLVLLPVERVFEPEGERYTLDEVAEESGLAREHLAQLQQALGLPVPAEGQRLLTQGDVEAARRAKAFLDAGLPVDSLIEISRVIGMSMSQLAAANREKIGQGFIEPGIDERELGLRYAAAAQTMSPLLAETLRYAHDRHLRESLREAVISGAERSEGSIEGADDVTIGFADLVDFTRLGERVEIDAIGQVTGRLQELATAAAQPPVRLVKLIGDAAMFAASEPAPLIDSVLGLIEVVGEDDGIPSLRGGVALGQALARGGDWYGRPVNLAARITSFARPDSVVVSDDVKGAVDGDAQFDFSFAGKRRFKGIRGEVPVHRVRRRGESG